MFAYQDTTCDLMQIPYHEFVRIFGFREFTHGSNSYKILMKIKKSGSKRVTPLSSYHNYYVNVMHNILANKNNAAIKIQAMIHTYLTYIFNQYF